MAAPRSKRGNPTARVGNYAAPVDTTGMDPEMKRTMVGSDSGYAKPSSALERLKGLFLGKKKAKS